MWRGPWPLSLREAICMRESHPAGGHPGDVNPMHLHPAGQCGGGGRGRHVVLDLALNDIIRWLFLSFLLRFFHLFTLLLPSSSPTGAAKYILSGEFAQMALRGGMPPPFVAGAHPGELILVSSSCGQRPPVLKFACHCNQGPEETFSFFPPPSVGKALLIGGFLEQMPRGWSKN